MKQTIFVPENNAAAAAEKMINNAALDDNHKTYAIGDYKQLLICSDNLTVYSAALAGVSKNNEKVDWNYSLANGGVALIGTAAAPIAVYTTWVIAVPVIAFAWEVTGVATYIFVDHSRIADTRSAIKRVGAQKDVISMSKDSFQQLVLTQRLLNETDEPDPGKRENTNRAIIADVTGKFESWDRAVTDVLLSLSDKKLCTPPVTLTTAPKNK